MVAHAAVRRCDRRNIQDRAGGDAVRPGWSLAGDAALAGRATRRVLLGWIDSRVEITNRLGTDQQRITEVPAVGEVDLDLTLAIANAQLHANHRSLSPGRLAVGIDIAGLFRARLDPTDAEQALLIKGVIRAIDGQAETHPVLAVSLELLDIAS